VSPVHPLVLTCITFLAQAVVSFDLFFKRARCKSGAILWGHGLVFSGVGCLGINHVYHWAGVMYRVQGWASLVIGYEQWV